MPIISNHTFDEITLGQTASSTRVVSAEDVRLFAAASGDFNPLHLDPVYAAGTVFGECIAHGMFTGGLISAALAMQLPGPGTVYLGQELKFLLPVKIGDTLTVELEVIDKKSRRRLVELDCRVTNQHGKKVVAGTARVMAPAQRETVTVTLPAPQP
jgi:acyl dehydratase